MSRRLPTVTARHVIRALERGGFVLHRVKGAHHHFIHPEDPRLLVVVPYHVGDLKRPVVRSVIKQAGLTVEEFLDLL